LKTIRPWIPVAVLFAAIAVSGCCRSPEALHELDVLNQTRSGQNKQEALQRYLTEHRLTKVALEEATYVPSMPPSEPPPEVPPAQPAPRADGAPEPLPSFWLLAKPPARGLQQSEWIHRQDQPGKPPRAFSASSVCLSGSSCGCDLRPDYALATSADGRVVVLRLNPTIHKDEVKQCGSCSVGCGQPSPPEPPRAFALPVDDVSKVDVVDVPFDWYGLHVRCSEEIPAP
jgi:hypothetical protein